MFEFETDAILPIARPGEDLPTVEVGKDRFDVSFWDGVKAAYRQEQIATNSWGQIRQTRNAVIGELIRQTDAILGEGEVQRRIDAETPVRDPASNEPITHDPDEIRLKVALSAAREVNLPLGVRSALDEEVQKRLQKDYLDASETLAFMQGGAGLAGFLGGSAAAITDPTSLALIPFGGGGRTAAQIILRESALGAVGEAATLPRRFDMAEYLEQPAPNVLASLLVGAAGGAVFAGGGMVATKAGRRIIADSFERAREWARFRNSAGDDLPGMGPAESAEATNIAASALDEGRLPAPEEMPAPTRPSEPLVPSEPYVLERSARAKPEPYVLDNAARVEPEFDWEAAERQADEIISNAAKEDRTLLRQQPLVDALRSQGGIAYTRLNPETGKRELTEIGQELKARDITPRSFPRLFNNTTGRGALDNLSPDDIGADHGLFRTIEGTLYIDPEDLLEKLTGELMDKTPTSLTRAAVEARGAADAIKSGSPLDAYKAQEPTEGGLFVDLNVSSFMDPLEWREAVSRDLDEYLTRTDLGAFIDYSERREIVDQLVKDGGEAEYLVERVLDRNLMYLESKYGARSEEGAGNPSRGDAEAGGQAGRAEPVAAGPEDAGADAGGSIRASEATAAGDQLLIDGVAPVTDRQRAETLMDTAKRGGDAEADFGLFDVSGRSQRDMFSDPYSPEAQERHITTIDGIRDEIEAGQLDLSVTQIDEAGNSRTITAQQAIAELDADEEFAEIANLCGRNPE